MIKTIKKNGNKRSVFAVTLAVLLSAAAVWPQISKGSAKRADAELNPSLPEMTVLAVSYNKEYLAANSGYGSGTEVFLSSPNYTASSWGSISLDGLEMEDAGGNDILKNAQTYSTNRIVINRTVSAASPQTNAPPSEKGDKLTFKAGFQVAKLAGSDATAEIKTDVTYIFDGCAWNRVMAPPSEALPMTVSSVSAYDNATYGEAIQVKLSPAFFAIPVTSSGSTFADNYWNNMSIENLELKDSGGNDILKNAQSYGTSSIMINRVTTTHGRRPPVPAARASQEGDILTFKEGFTARYTGDSRTPTHAIGQDISFRYNGSSWVIPSITVPPIETLDDLIITGARYTANISTYDNMGYLVGFAPARPYNVGYRTAMCVDFIEFKNAAGNNILTRAEIFGTTSIALNRDNTRAPVNGDRLTFKRGFTIILSSGGDVPTQALKADVTFVYEDGLMMTSAARAVYKLIDALYKSSVDELTSADVGAITAAREAYDRLFITEKLEILIHDKLLFAEAKIPDLYVSASADEFRAAHAAVLALTVQTAAAGDKAAVQAALDAYDALSGEVKAKLTTEKAKLDSLLVKIADLETAQAVIGMIAALPALADLMLADKGAVEAARAAYNALAAGPKAVVIAANLSALTAAEAKIAELEEGGGTGAGKRGGCGSVATVTGGGLNGITFAAALLIAAVCKKRTRAG